MPGLGVAVLSPGSACGGGSLVGMADSVLRIILVSLIIVGGKVGGWAASTLLCDVASAMFGPLSGTTGLEFDTFSL